MTLSNASRGLTSDGVVIDDPDSPWRLRARSARRSDGRPVLVELTISARDDDPPTLTNEYLCRLGIRSILRIAAALELGGSFDNEAYYRSLAADTVRSRTWPPDHYRRVSTVAEWAVAIDRPGGAAAAIAEFWDVTSRTAYRWLRHARLRSALASTVRTPAYQSPAE